MFDHYKDKTVFITGHTGFQGSWLCEWLLSLGAKIVGYSLEPPTQPSHFKELGLSKRIHQDIRADVRHKDTLQEAIEKENPDFIFHLAAQSLVRESFDEPYQTFETNFVGSLNLLEVIKKISKDCIVIIATTDKVYQNQEWLYSYRENDNLGGHDPYSASKACVETLVSSYQSSFFHSFDKAEYPLIYASTVRGGNVIGGGDWSKDRLIPDCVRNLTQKKSIPIRNKSSTRPWQHVLDLLSGYLLLGDFIWDCFHNTQKQDRNILNELGTPVNIGPDITSNRTVEKLALEILKYWPGKLHEQKEKDHKHESHKLNISYDKAYHLLGWLPCWNFQESVKYTANWYLSYYKAQNKNSDFVIELTQKQIQNYMNDRYLLLKKLNH